MITKYFKTFHRLQDISCVFELLNSIVVTRFEILYVNYVAAMYVTAVSSTLLSKQ